MTTFLAELRRRHVFRVAAGYVVAAWLIMQAAVVIEGAMGLPEWFDGLVLALLALGFPVALILAWAFEVTPEGVRRTAPAGGEAAPNSFAVTDVVIIAAVVAVLGVSLYQAIRPGAAPATSVDAPTATADDLSIAVLPFADMSPEGDQEYFTDGLSEELLNQLAQIDALRVIGRTSSFAFKGRDVDLRTIGETLGVGTILEGSVRKSGDELRITAQLIDASDGSHLWSQTYDRRLDDVFSIQDDISRAVADALSLALGVGESARTLGGTENVAAYELVLRARDVMIQASQEDRGPRAAALYRQAIALDPEYAQAWLGLAGALSFALAFEAGPARAEELRRDMNMALDRALALAPNLADALALRANVLAAERDWRGAAQAWARWSEAAPPEYQTCLAGGDPQLVEVGFTSELDACWRVERDRDPLSLRASAGLQNAFTMEGRFREAEAEYERSRALVGDRESAEHYALLRAWEGDDAAKIEARMRRYLDYNTVEMPVFHAVFDVFDDADVALDLLRPAVDDSAYHTGPRLGLLALWLGHYGDPESAVEALRRFYLEQDGVNYEFLWFPSLAEARRLPAFKDLVRELGMVDYWRETGEWGDFCRPLGDDDFECF